MLCDYWHKEWKHIPFSGAELPIKDDTGIRGFQFLGWHLGWDVHSGEFYIATSPHLTSKSFGWNPPKMNWHFRNHMFNSMLSWSSNWHQTCRCSLNQKGDIGIWWDMWYLWKRAGVSVMCRSPDVLLQWRTASLPLQMLAPRAVEMRKRSGTLWHWTSHKIH